MRVAVIREEGSNGDREMAAAVWSGGMEPWDLTMSDLLNGRASLDSFQGKDMTRRILGQQLAICLPQPASLQSSLIWCAVRQW